MKPEESPCPVCKAPSGCLSVRDELVASQLGDFSLSGNQMKVSARTRPVLRCATCDLSVAGEYDDEGHVVFIRPKES
jgi:hypothetical protein